MAFCLPEYAVSQAGFIRYYSADQQNLSLSFIVQDAVDHLVLGGQTGGWWPYGYLMQVDSAGDVSWKRSAHVSGQSYRWGMLQFDQNLYFEAGMTTSDAQLMSDPYLHCFNKAGDSLWTRTYDNYTFDQFTGLTSNLFGHLYSLGMFEDITSESHTYVCRLDPNGNMVWRHDFGGTYQGASEGILAMANGTVLVTYSMDGFSHWAKLDSNGTLLSDVAVFSGIGTLPCMKPFETASGDVLSFGNDSTLRLRNTDGTHKLVLRQHTGILGLINSSDGNYLLLRQGTGAYDFFLTKLDDSLLVIWERSFDFPEAHASAALLQSSNGDIYIAGTRGTNPFDPYTGFLLRTDCEGNLTNYNHCAPPSGLPSTGLACYPNPFDDVLYVFNDHESLITFTLTDMQGRDIYTVSCPQGRTELLLAGLSQGIYIYAMLDGNGKRHQVGKLVK